MLVCGCGRWLIGWSVDCFGLVVGVLVCLKVALWICWLGVWCAYWLLGLSVALIICV